MSRPVAPDIRSLVAEAYTVFGHHRAPSGPLDACTGCCLPPEMERDLRTLKLSLLTEEHFYEYNTAAKSKVQPAPEILHLLPRLLELLAEGATVHHSIELSLDRLGRCPPGSLTPDEAHLLDRFALAYFERLLADRKHPWQNDPLDVVLMFHIGGRPITPLLDAWLAATDPATTVQFVESTYWNFWANHACSNAFAQDRPEFQAELRAWMLDPLHRARWTERLLAPEFLDLTKHHPDRGAVPFDIMLDTAFHHLAG